MLLLHEEEWKGEKTGWREKKRKEPKQEEKEGRKRNRVKENQRQPQSQMTVGSLGGGFSRPQQADPAELRFLGRQMVPCQSGPRASRQKLKTNPLSYLLATYT